MSMVSNNGTRASVRVSDFGKGGRLDYREPDEQSYADKQNAQEKRYAPAPTKQRFFR